MQKIWSVDHGGLQWNMKAIHKFYTGSTLIGEDLTVLVSGLLRQVYAEPHALSLHLVRHV